MTPNAEEPARRDTYTANIVPYVLFHVAAIGGAIYVGVTWQYVLLAVAAYFVRMFAITAGLHRYFAHRAFKTSRWFQFLLALGATTAMQKGALWWASVHRHHHRHSDDELDIHSPRRRGFWYAHTGWILSSAHDETRWDDIRDFAKYPELVWLDRHHLVVSIGFGVVMLVCLGWEATVWGFLVSTTVLWHGTFTINSFSHIWGRQRYDSGDDSKNSFILALITMGEGWHNNHHYYQSSANQGFFWWEVDVSYYILRALSWTGLVWDLRKPPEKALRGELGRKLERVESDAEFRKAA